MTADSPIEPAVPRQLPGTVAPPSGATSGTQNSPATPVEPALPPAAPDSLFVKATTASTVRQLADMPREELDHLAEEYGLDFTRFKTRQELVAAIHDRRQMIATLDREAMLDVVRWGNRPVTAIATHDQLAREIARIPSMRFSGLSQRGLAVLAKMRGVEVKADEPIPELIRKLKKQEGLFAKLGRKRRALLGSVVSKIVGDDGGKEEYQFVPNQPGEGYRPPSIKKDIEESGLLGGLTNRIKKTADGYVNQKLDEIEARIDRKLDEIDRRLAEWRDKEIANRIRILKITLWASVIVAVISMIYTFLKMWMRG